MIEYSNGNLLDAQVDALVNTVNCVGIMGKGVALQFKQRFPDNFRYYEKACRKEVVRTGTMLVFETGHVTPPRYIINFPTKVHWRGKSRMEYVDTGLQDLRAVVLRLAIHSLAVPPLGCGSGGLRWQDVRASIERELTDIPGVRVIVFPPAGAPNPAKDSLRSTEMKLTRARALLVLVMESYRIPGYRLGLLEAQKLAYLLQRAGEDLRLNFVKNQYGPYADNLNHALQNMEGKLLVGYGDRTRSASIRPLPGSADAARSYLSGDHSSKAHLSQVKRLIEGFEMPHGLELLATVDWVATHDPLAAVDPDVAIAAVHRWGARKREKFPQGHIRLAWKRFEEQGWWCGLPQLGAGS